MRQGELMAALDLLSIILSPGQELPLAVTAVPSSVENRRLVLLAGGLLSQMLCTLVSSMVTAPLKLHGAFGLGS
jgi:hypothetical protein